MFTSPGTAGCAAGYVLLCEDEVSSAELCESFPPLKDVNRLITVIAIHMRIQALYTIPFTAKGDFSHTFVQFLRGRNAIPCSTSGRDQRERRQKWTKMVINQS